jgi:mono/diheme cytochrome c family protein
MTARWLTERRGQKKLMNKTTTSFFLPPSFCQFFLLALWLVPCAAASPFIAGLAREGRDKVAGKVLVSELGCASCHATARAEFAAKPGPDLSAVGARVLGGHLQRFIAAPSATKPGTTMPDVLGHLPATERAATADALAHYLATLGGAQPIAAKPAPEAVARGKALYHTVGCVACHSPEAPLADSVPLGPVAEKYSIASLAAFLEDPLAVRPSGRMPNLKLEGSEAVDLASYLLRDQAAPAAFKPDPQLAERGKALFAQHRCDACHAVGSPRATPALVALDKARPERGCLSGQSGAWPQYLLRDAQRSSVRVALAAPAAPLSVAENVELTLTRLNCLACHQRGELGGVPANRNPHFTGKDENLGDQGRIPPPLTGVGAKLKATWLRDVVASGASVRPYLNTRMPKFGAANTEPLAGWLKQLDTLPPAEFTRVRQPEKPHDAGRELAGSKGMNCIACHTFREKSAAPIRALDLMTLAERLEENWFHHYMSSPQRFSPLTIMPGFWPDGKSPLPDVLGGDPGKQRDALWQWLARGPEAGEPRGLVLEPLVVAVTNEAVIIRRAFPGIGKRGIGVGYPAGINLSFDAGQLRLGSLWSGGFIEASSIWRGQGAGQAHILGKDTMTFPPGVAFAVLESPATAWPTNLARQAEGFAFKGYSLDAQQRPTFRYEFSDVLVEDFFLDTKAGDGKPHLVRSLKFPQRPPPPGLHFRAAADKQLEARGENTFAIGKGLLVRLSAAGVMRLSAAGVMRESDGVKELLLPVRGAFTVEYQLTAKP